MPIVSYSSKCYKQVYPSPDRARIPRYPALDLLEALDVVQIDSCRLAGVSEVLSVLLMAAK